jgi:hypothetical protein
VPGKGGDQPSGSPGTKVVKAAVKSNAGDPQSENENVVASGIVSGVYPQ